MLYKRDYILSKAYFTPFTVQNLRMHLVKIDQVCFGYLATFEWLIDNRAEKPNSFNEDEINQIVHEAIIKTTKRQTKRSIAIFKGK